MQKQIIRIELKLVASYHLTLFYCTFKQNLRMRILFILPLFLVQFCFGQTDPVYSFEHVEFMTKVPNAGEAKVKRLSNAIHSYIKTIESKDFEGWKELLSDSTKTRLETKKFKNKFNRLVAYGLTSDSIKVISVTKLSKTYANEVGTEYEILLEFNHDLNALNRVSFDITKRTSDSKNMRRFGINVVSDGKNYVVCEHKYNN
jgi:hypothetical protein